MPRAGVGAAYCGGTRSGIWIRAIALTIIQKSVAGDGEQADRHREPGDRGRLHQQAVDGGEDEEDEDQPGSRAPPSSAPATSPRP